MDNEGDPSISFDGNGFCNYCNEALTRKNKVYFPGPEGEKKLDELLDKVKEAGRGKPYDCLMGLSGGLDSSYLAYLGSRKFGLRILALHVDDGFDTDITKENLKKISETCGVDLCIEKPDPKQFCGLTAAFLRAGVPNIAIPQDNLIFSYLHRHAKKHKISYFLSGGNFALESILQRGNSHSAFDAAHINDINKKFGKYPLDKLEITSTFKQKIEDRFRFGLKVVRPLNLMDYRKKAAISELQKFCGFNYYGGKHCESVLTKFMQVYYLPKKFNVDKRKSHLSSMIISGQTTREEALEELKKPLFNQSEMEQDIQYILDRLEITKNEFNEIMSAPPKSHVEYKTSMWLLIWALRRKIRGY